MSLYSISTCPYCQRVRLVLEEKGVDYQVTEVNVKQKPASFLELSPYGQVPVLVDRELVIYESNIICEYLDERFPHPPMMPVDPLSRARARLLLYRVDQDWVSGLVNPDDDFKARLEKEMVEVASIFAHQPFALGEDFGIVDCALLTLLWHLQRLEVPLPKGLEEYAERGFARDSFKEAIG